MRGDGRIFQQKGSPYLWIAYYCRGTEHRESCKTTDRALAEKLLRKRLKEVGADQIGAKRFLGPKAERVTMDALFDALGVDKKNNGALVPSEMPRLRAYWQGRLALNVTGAEIDRWVSELTDAKLSKKTIRNYQQLLGQAFKLAVRQERLAYAPPIKSLKVGDNARQGSYTRAEFERIKALLPAYLHDFCEWAYWTGWRAGAIRSLRWADITDDNVLTLRAQYSKTRRAQDIPLSGPLAEIIERRRADKKGEFVFHYPDNHPRKGQVGKPIGSYKTAWATATRKAGLAGKIFHDFRRTAATNLRRAGVPEEVAMRITGHVTNTMFKRYRIVDQGDLTRALEQRNAYETAQLTTLPTATRAVQ